MLTLPTLLLTAVLLAPPADAKWPPRTTLAELNAMVEAGNYHLVRREKLGHQIEAEGIVDKVGRWPLLKLDGDWHASLHGLPDEHGLEPGDRVKFHALLVDEAFQNLTLWTYRMTKEPPSPKAPAPQ